MKLTVIGNWGAYPEPNEATSGYLIEVNNKKILLDCGSGALSSLSNFIRLEELDAIIISHYHYDHFIDIFPLHYATEILTKRGFRKKPLEIYCRNDNEYFDKIAYKDVCRTNEIKEDTILNIDGIKITFQKTLHQVMCLGIKIEYDNKALVYSADTGYTDKIITFAKNADLFICEACLLAKQKGMNNGHLTSTEAGEIARLAKVKRLVLTHFPHDEDITVLKEEAESEYKDGKVDMAKKGLSIMI